MKQGLRTFIILAGILTVVTIMVYAAFRIIGMEYYPAMYLIVPLFFLVAGFIPSYLAAKYMGKELMPSMHELLIARVVKLIGGVALFIVGVILDRTHIISFTLTFVLFYVVYLIYETQVMVKLNKKDKSGL